MNPILVPVDGSDCSSRALDFAAELAAKLGSPIVLCHVLDVGRAAAMSGGEPQLIAGCLDMLETEGKEIIDEAVARVTSGVAVSSRTPEGEPVEEIERLASELKPSFIAIGTHGRTGLSRLMMGSVAEGVVRKARFPVMVVPCTQKP